MYNYTRLNSNNLLHILEGFLLLLFLLFFDTIWSHAFTWFNLIKTGQCGVSWSNNYKQVLSQKSSSEYKNTISESNWGKYYRVSVSMP